MLDYTIIDNLDNGVTFILLVGPPGSGKTEIADKLVEYYDFVKISPDDIRKELFGNPHDQKHNTEVFSTVYSRINSSLKSGFNVVYDATNCRPAYRLKIIDIVENWADNIYCFCAESSIVDCVEKNKKYYENSVPEDVIEKMYFTLKKHPPTIYEGYDLIAGF